MQRLILLLDHLKFLKTTLFVFKIEVYLQDQDNPLNGLASKQSGASTVDMAKGRTLNIFFEFD